MIVVYNGPHCTTYALCSHRPQNHTTSSYQTGHFLSNPFYLFYCHDSHCSESYSCKYTRGLLFAMTCPCGSESIFLFFLFFSLFFFLLTRGINISMHCNVVNVAFLKCTSVKRRVKMERLTDTHSPAF